MTTNMIETSGMHTSILYRADDYLHSPIVTAASPADIKCTFNFIRISSFQGIFPFRRSEPDVLQMEPAQIQEI